MKLSLAAVLLTLTTIANAFVGEKVSGETSFGHSQIRVYASGEIIAEANTHITVKLDVSTTKIAPKAQKIRVAYLICAALGYTNGGTILETGKTWDDAFSLTGLDKGSHKHWVHPRESKIVTVVRCDL